MLSLQSLQAWLVTSSGNRSSPQNRLSHLAVVILVLAFPAEPERQALEERVDGVSAVTTVEEVEGCAPLDFVIAVPFEFGQPRKSAICTPC